MKEPDMNRYLKEIVNTMNDGVTIVSPDGTIVMVNRAMEEITGYSRDELMGRSCSIFHCDACERVRAGGRGHWCELFEAGQAHKKSCLLMRKDGSYVHVLKNASLLKSADGTLLGAVETVTDLSEIEERDERIEQLSKLLDIDTTFHGLVGGSQAMRRVFAIIGKAAQSEAPVIIHGETGTGKDLVARAIHDLGRRRCGPYIQLNCAALNEALLESELFGHVKGAFTGAYMHRKGRFEAAGGGDIFLDEIGDIPLSIQVKLLRVLETKEFERVGDQQSIKADVRIITATNRDLEQLISQGKFREDFYFRINTVPIHLPPLRERPDDIPLLADHFIRRLRQKSGKDISGPSPETMGRFMNHHWPGNVRELRGVLEYAFVLAEKGLILPEHLPVKLLNPSAPEPGNLKPRAKKSTPSEKTALLEALIQCGGNQTQAARLLGVNRVTVWHRLKKYGIDISRLELE
ncbi:MAG: sigma 54-interacting transcriptional regulator [Syntrophobacteraceae bacterium]